MTRLCLLASIASLSALLGCHGTPSLPDGSVPTSGWCSLPGSVAFFAGGQHIVVPGGSATPDLTWMTAPPGFCVHYFGNVPDARQIRFAPGGEAFVASPAQGTTGGGPGGKAAVLVLADDNHDGVADQPYATFLGNLPTTQGLLFTPGSFYYQDGTAIRQLAYSSGQRTAAQAGQAVVDVSAPTYYVSSLHWPKSIDIADDGTLYTTNGSDQGEVCYASRPFVGGVIKIDGTPGGAPIMKGMRNPISIRCHRGHNTCYGAELALDYSSGQGGREKLYQIQTGGDLGYPCCATANLAYSGVQAANPNGTPVGAPDCSKVNAEIVSFIIGRTPMSLDFEPGRWPAPWQGSVLMGLHGEFGTWAGAKVIAVAADASGDPQTASELAGGNAAALSTFASGWDDGKNDHGRPDDLTFASDGRLFLTNDVTGDIVWFAPVSLADPVMDGGTG